MERDRVCRTVLELAEATGGGASLESVGRSEITGATLVRVRVGQNAQALLSTLRLRFPLATASLVQNRLTGQQNAQVLLPNEEEAERHASTLAHGAPIATHIKRAALGLLAVLLVRIAIGLS